MIVYHWVQKNKKKNTGIFKDRAVCSVYLLSGDQILLRQFRAVIQKVY